VDGGQREEMTAAAIARLAGVGRAAVSNWRRRYPGFPKPVGGSPTSPTFDRVEWLAWLYARIGQGLPAFGPPGHRPRISFVTLAELERADALRIRPRDATPREGDVLLRTLGRPPTVATGTNADDTGVAQIVEIDATRLDAHFVATFLRADVAALPVANTLGAVSREDLRRCRIPRMPLAEQRLYGEEFRRLLELDAALKALADVSGK